MTHDAPRSGEAKTSRQLLIDTAEVIRCCGKVDLAGDLVAIAEDPEEPTLYRVAEAADRELDRPAPEMSVHHWLAYVAAIGAILRAAATGRLKPGGCILPGDGGLCGLPVVVFHPRDGCLVCARHAPIPETLKPSD